jgi:hypothetical protein
MKSANGSRRMLHQMAFIRWGKRRAVTRSEMIQVLGFPCARCSRNLSRHSARETFPRALASSDFTNHHSRGTCQPGSLLEQELFQFVLGAGPSAATHATMRSMRSAFPLGTPKTRHSATASCSRNACSMMAGDTLRPATLIWSPVRPRKINFAPALKFGQIAGAETGPGPGAGRRRPVRFAHRTAAHHQRPVSPSFHRPRFSWAADGGFIRARRQGSRRRRCRRIRWSRKNCGFSRRDLRRRPFQRERQRRARGNGQAHVARDRAGFVPGVPERRDGGEVRFRLRVRRATQRHRQRRRHQEQRNAVQQQRQHQVRKSVGMRQRNHAEVRPVGRRPIVATMLSASAASCSSVKATVRGAPVLAG